MAFSTVLRRSSSSAFLPPRVLLWAFRRHLISGTLSFSFSPCAHIWRTLASTCNHNRLPCTSHSHNLGGLGHHLIHIKRQNKTNTGIKCVAETDTRCAVFNAIACIQEKHLGRVKVGGLLSGARGRLGRRGRARSARLGCVGHARRGRQGSLEHSSCVCLNSVEQRVCGKCAQLSSAARKRRRWR